MEVRSYEYEQYTKLKNNRDNENGGGIAKKVHKMRLRWYGEVMKREKHYVRRKEGDGNENTGETEERKT